MANILADRVLESSVSAGTGVFTLVGPVLGFRAFSAVCAVTDTMPYYIEAVDTVGRPTGEWEYGLGTYSAANQLTRTTVRGSSNAGLTVAFAAGTKLVGLGIAAPNSTATRLEWRDALSVYSKAEVDALIAASIVPSASETEQGKVERLTTSEARAGTDTTRYHSAATLKAAQIQLGTAVIASGTSIDFTDIPAWAKRVTVLFSALSTNGSSPPIAQLGAGSIQAFGYSFSGADVNGSNSCGVASNGNGFALGGRYLPGAASILSGLLQITKVTGNTWAVFGCAQNTGVAYFGGGTVALSGDLDRIRFTTVAGTDSFDAGTVNISWE